MQTCPNSSFQLFSSGNPSGFQESYMSKSFYPQGRKFFSSALKCLVCFTNTHQTRNNAKLCCAIKRNSVAGHLTQTSVFWVVLVSKLNCHLTQVRRRHAPEQFTRPSPLQLFCVTSSTDIYGNKIIYCYFCRNRKGEKEKRNDYKLKYTTGKKKLNK